MRQEPQPCPMCHADPRLWRRLQEVNAKQAALVERLDNAVSHLRREIARLRSESADAA
jgi:hypothetical protein